MGMRPIAVHERTWVAPAEIIATPTRDKIRETLPGLLGRIRLVFLIVANSELSLLATCGATEADSGVDCEGVRPCPATAERGKIINRNPVRSVFMVVEYGMDSEHATL